MKGGEHLNMSKIISGYISQYVMNQPQEVVEAFEYLYNLRNDNRSIDTKTRLRFQTISVESRLKANLLMEVLYQRVSPEVLALKVNQ